jgi:predicted permease
VGPLWRRILYIWNRKQNDSDLADEMAFHQEMQAQAGSSSFGNALRLREQARDGWGWLWVDQTEQDLRYGLRKLWASPGFSLGAILMLAVGIGINLAAFGFFNLVVLRPLPIREPQSLLHFQREAPDSFSTALAYPAFEFYQANSSQVSGWIGVSRSNLRINDEPQTSSILFVSPSYFSELGASFQMGRSFESNQDSGVAVMSYGYWQRRFGGDPAIVGKTLLLNRKRVTIAGVCSRQFSGLRMEAPALWLSLRDQPLYVDGSKLLTSYSSGTKGTIAKGAAGIETWGRLKEGATRASAEQELQALTATLRKQHPDDFWEKERLVSEAGGYALQIQDEMKPILLLVSTLCLLILVAACGNLGGMLLARGIARQREMQIRRDIGAGRSRLIRQLFTESLVLTVFGLLAAVGFAWGAMKILFVATEAPEWIDVQFDWRMLCFALGIGFLAAMLFGLAPAIQIAKDKQKSGKVRAALLSLQVAASCVLLIVSGLLVRALNHVLITDPGFSYQQVVSIDPDLRTYGYSDSAAKNYIDALQSRLSSLPGTESISQTVSTPLGRKNITRATIQHNTGQLDIYMIRTDAAFQRTMRIPLKMGRWFAPTDPGGVVISEAMARRMWPNEDPLGKPYDLGGKEPHRVIGVSANARIMSLNNPEAMELYYPIQSEDSPSLQLLLKSKSDLASLRQQILAVAKAVDPKVVPEVQSVQSSFDRQVLQLQQAASAVSALGAVALLLAAIGVLGQVSYVVTQRTREIGIRMALGAGASQVLRSILQQFLQPILAGLLLGAVFSSLLAQMLRKELYGISYLDPLAYAGAALIFTVTAAMAAIAPARRALSILPSEALRSD